MDLRLPTATIEADEGATYRPRRSARVTLHEATRLRASDKSNVDVTMCDISTSGFMAECLRPVLIGSYVSIDVPGIGPVHAQVRWQVGGRLGGKFLDPITLHRCAWIVARD